MPRGTISRGLLVAWVCLGGPARAQAPTEETPASPTSPASGPGPSSAPAAPAEPASPPPPAPAPAPAPGARPPGAVQTFEPADVVAPKAGEATSVATEPTTTPPGAMPLTMDEMPVAASNNRVTLNMFSDTAFVVDSSAPRQPGFVIGDFDLLLTGRSGNLTALAETALEQRGGGEIGIDLERIFVGWRGERVSVDAGRTHAELGYWNSAFHHGRWLQITVDRPQILKFEDEGGILPVHLVGVAGHYRPFIDGDRQIELVASAGNGRGDIADDVLETGDTNGWKALLAKLAFKGFGARDLQFGISGLFDRIAALPMTGATADAFARPALPDQSIGELVGNAYLAYRGVELTVIAEAFDILHTAAMPSVTGVSHWNTFDSYALFAYRFGDFSPYAMGEIRRTSGDPDPFFFPDPRQPSEVLRNFEEVTAGVRWDIMTWSALKLEYRGRFEGSTHLHTGTLDWCFGL